jgi:parallel beta-helix repeat protein
VSGQFAVDASRRVVLGDNPAGHKVEVTTRREWIDTASSDVTIQGFTLKHASNDSQSGAVNSGGFSRVTIQDNVLSDAHGANASLSTGTDLKLLRNDISRGGQLGVHGDRADALVQGNKIYNNNTEDFGWGWEAGGLKMAVMRSLTLDGNEVYDNKGPGLWCDIDCTNTVFSNNRVHHNTAPGIFFEISSGAKIFGNTVWENGYDDPTWGWGAGILSSSSQNVEIYDNVVAWNADGISVVSQGRGTWSTVQNVNVHDNDILMKNWTSVPSDHMALSWLQDHAGVMYNSTSNNRGSLNRYYYTPAEPTWCRFSWNGCISTIASFNSTPGEEGGRYLTESEKDQVLSSQGVPTTSEHS